jgi:phosphoribulokinase
VTYDKIKQKLVKENSRFEFDQTIYLDLFLNINKEKAEKHQAYLDQIKTDLKIMKDTYSKYSESGDGQS